jgi:hypothetical protein
MVTVTLLNRSVTSSWIIKILLSASNGRPGLLSRAFPF